MRKIKKCNNNHTAKSHLDIYCLPHKDNRQFQMELCITSLMHSYLVHKTFEQFMHVFGTYWLIKQKGNSEDIPGDFVVKFLNLINF